MNKKKNKCVAINFTIPHYLLEFFEDECAKKSFMAATSYNRNRMMVKVLEDYYESTKNTEFGNEIYKR